jgi:hypothetical protein
MMYRDKSRIPRKEFGVILSNFYKSLRVYAFMFLKVSMWLVLVSAIYVKLVGPEHTLIVINVVIGCSLWNHLKTIVYPDTLTYRNYLDLSMKLDDIVTRLEDIASGAYNDPGL